MIPVPIHHQAPVPPPSYQRQVTPCLKGLILTHILQMDGVRMAYQAKPYSRAYHNLYHLVPLYKRTQKDVGKNQS